MAGHPLWRAPGRCRSRAPEPLDDAASAPPAADSPRYEAAYQRRYDYDWPRLPFPFLFGAKRRVLLDCEITDDTGVAKQGLMIYMQHLEHITAAV